MQVLSLESESKTVGLYDGLQLASMVRVWWFYRRLILMVMLFVVLATVVFVGSKEKLFTSVALIRIHYAPEDNVIGGSPDGQDQRNNPVIANSIAFMSSRSFLSMVAEKQKLFDDPEFSPEPDELSTEESGGRRPDQRHFLRNAVVDALAERLIVTQRGGSHVISVESTSTDPRKAARIANAAVNVFRDKELSRLEAVEQRYLKWLTSQIRDARGQLVSLDMDLLKLSSKHGLGELQEAPSIGQANSVQWTELTNELADIKAERTVLQARHENALSWAANNGVEASLAIAKSPALDELRNLETTLIRRLSELGREFGERHPTIVNLQNELKTTRQRMLEEADAAFLRVRGELLINNAREAEIEAQIANLDQEISSQQGVYSEVQELHRAIERSQSKLEKIVDRKMTIEENQMVRQGMSDAMSPASVPTVHSFPAFWPAIAYALFGATLFSLICIFLHDRWISDFGFTGPEDLRALNMHPIGIVPEFRGKAFRRTAVEDQVVIHPHSVEAEAIQRVRNHLSKLRPNNAEAATVVSIASSSPEEGKTTMAVALARQAAIAGSKVLFVDADIRYSSGADFMGLETTAGLSEFLLKDWQSEIQIGQDPQTPLQVLQAGSFVSSPADLFRSEQMSDLLDELRHRYDWIFLDSPPLGAFVDGIVLAKHADLVIYVARWLKTTRNVVQMGIDQLRNAGITCAGVALTRVDMDSYQKYRQMEELRYYAYSSLKV